MVFAKNKSAILSKETVIQMFEKINLVKSQNKYIFFSNKATKATKMTLFEKCFVGRISHSNSVTISDLC